MQDEPDEILTFIQSIFGDIVVSVHGDPYILGGKLEFESMEIEFINGRRVAFGCNRGPTCGWIKAVE